MPVSAAHNDDDDVPLAKRQRVLQGSRGGTAPPLHSQRAPSPEVVELLDDSDDPDAPAFAPESSEASPPSGRAAQGGEGPPSRHPSSPVGPVEVGEVEEIEVGLTSEDGADVIVISDDDDEPAVEGEVEGPRAGAGAAREQPPRAVEAKAEAKKEPPARLPSLFDPSHPFSPAKRAAEAPPAREAPPRPAAPRAPRPVAPAPAAAPRPPPPPPRPPRGPALDEPYVFDDPAARGEFRRSFGKPPRASPGMSQAALERRAKEILHDMTRPARQAMQKSKVAWNQAAMLWREKNKPSAAELERRAAEDAARMSSGRPRLNPRDHAARAGAGASSGDEAAAPPRRPDDGAAEAEWRAYYRHVAQAKASPAFSFGAVLRVFGVPCDESPRGVKDGYRLAVRMFHPDSNSRERAWATPTEKMQAEEVMKIINERKEQEGY